MCFVYNFRYALVSPRERKVVIIENVLCPTEVREALAKVLFCHLEVMKLEPMHIFSAKKLFNIKLGFVGIICTNTFGCIGIFSH